MISKGIVAAWSTFVGMHLLYLTMEPGGSLSLIALIVSAFVWALIAVPVSSVGRLFETPVTDPVKLKKNKQILAGICVVVAVFFVMGNGEPGSGQGAYGGAQQTHYRSYR